MALDHVGHHVAGSPAFAGRLGRPFVRGHGPGGGVEVIAELAIAGATIAVLGMSLPLARDLAPVGIRVCAIAPGTMGTPLMESAPDAMKEKLVANIIFPKRMGQPAEYAKLVQSIVDNSYLNGEVIRIDGALRFGPKSPN